MEEITVAEAAEILDFTERGVRMAIAAGRLPGRRLGKYMLLLKRVDVERYNRERKRGIGRPRKVQADAEEVAV